MISTFDIAYNGSFLSFNKWIGITYFSKCIRKPNNETIPNQILNPFIVHTRITPSPKVNISSFATIYALLLLWAAKHCYPIIYLLSHLRLQLFVDAQQASWAFQQITKNEQQKLLCLPRSVFIATTSKRFKEYGAMYIGIFLPSRNMHAWVIEDNLQTDEWDNYWILYQPLMMMCG